MTLRYLPPIVKRLKENSLNLFYSRNKNFKEILSDNKLSLMLFMIIQPIIVLLSPYIQRLFSQLIDHKNLFHLLFIFFVIIPYISIGIYFIFSRGRYETPVRKPSLNLSKIDAAACILLVLTATAMFYKFSTHPLPVGYDTPIYLAKAKLIMNRGLDFSSILWSREIYIRLSSVALSIVKDDIILGKLLWTQVFLIICANYFLVSWVTNSRIIGFTSSLIWILWPKTTRLIWDLHSNTFAIFLMLILYLTFLRANYEKSRKLFFTSLLILLLIWFVHQLTFIVGFLTLLTFSIIDSCSSENSSILEMLNIINRKSQAIVKRLFLFSPLIIFVIIYIVIEGFNMTSKLSCMTRDLLRVWWPEIPIWKFNNFVNSLGGWFIFLLAELGVLYLILFPTSPFHVLPFIHLMVSLSLYQNFLFGIHALPERFGIYIFMPIYSALGVFLLNEFLRSTMKTLKIKLKFRQVTHLISPKAFRVFLLAILAGGLMVSLMPIQLATVNRYGPTITLEEYNAMLYLRDNHLHTMETDGPTIIILPRYGLEYWIKNIIPEIKLGDANASGEIAAKVVWKINSLLLEEMLKRYKTVYLFNFKIESLDFTAYVDQSTFITYGNITIIRLSNQSSRL